MGLENIVDLTKYEKDPVGFARDVLGVELYKAQQTLLESLVANRKVSAASEPIVGLTFAGAVAALWWVHTAKRFCIPLCPTSRSLKHIFMREVKKLHKAAKVKLPGRVGERNHKGADWGIYGFHAGQTGNWVAGIHEVNVLFIEDNAHRIPAKEAEEFSGITATVDSRHLKLGHLARTALGHYVDQLVPDEVEQLRWERHAIFHSDTPNYRERRVVIPGLPTPEWIAEFQKRRREGRL